MNLLKLSLKYFMSDKNFKRYDEKIENLCEFRVLKGMMTRAAIVCQISKRKRRKRNNHV